MILSNLLYLKTFSLDKLGVDDFHICTDFCFSTFFAVAVQLPSRVWLLATPWTVAHQASLSITITRSWPNSVSVASVMPSIHPSHSLTQSSPPAFDLSQHQGLFHWVDCSHQMAKILKPSLEELMAMWMLNFLIANKKCQVDYF